MFCATALQFRLFAARTAERQGCKLQQQQCDHNQFGCPHNDKSEKGAESKMFQKYLYIFLLYQSVKRIVTVRFEINDAYD